MIWPQSQLTSCPLRDSNTIRLSYAHQTSPMKQCIAIALLSLPHTPTPRTLPTRPVPNRITCMPTCIRHPSSKRTCASGANQALPRS